MSMTGQIVTASFEDGIDRGPECGNDECDCNEHEGAPRKAGTYILVRLDEDVPVGLWRVTVDREEASA